MDPPFSLLVRWKIPLVGYGLLSATPLSLGSGLRVGAPAHLPRAGPLQPRLCPDFGTGNSLCFGQDALSC